MLEQVHIPYIKISSTCVKYSMCLYVMHFDCVNRRVFSYCWTYCIKSNYCKMIWADSASIYVTWNLSIGVTQKRKSPWMRKWMGEERYSEVHIRRWFNKWSNTMRRKILFCLADLELAISFIICIKVATVLRCFSIPHFSICPFWDESQHVFVFFFWNWPLKYGRY